MVRLCDDSTFTSVMCGPSLSLLGRNWPGGCKTTSLRKMRLNAASASSANKKNRWNAWTLLKTQNKHYSHHFLKVSHYRSSLTFLITSFNVAIGYTHTTVSNVAFVILCHLLNSSVQFTHFHRRGLNRLTLSRPLGYLLYSRGGIMGGGVICKFRLIIPIPMEFPLCWYSRPVLQHCMHGWSYLESVLGIHFYPLFCLSPHHASAGIWGMLWSAW